MRSEKRISKKVFKELASKNVKKSAKDYFIYFFTLTFAVCLFYTFNSVDVQFAALGLPDSLNYMAAAVFSMAGVSVLVCVIIGFLVVYANSFLMKRRKREFGIYSVLGMTRRDINRILMKETIAIGSASLLSGILLGIVVSQGLSMITAKIAGTGIAGYQFILSGNAVLTAIFFFCVTFFCVYLFNKRQVKKMKLIDLLYADRKNEKVPEIKKWDIICGILSLVFIGAGYLVIFHFAGTDFGNAVLLGGIFLSLGTFAFFMSAAGLLCKILKKRKSFYYRRLNIFNVNQLGSRFKSTGSAIAVVCILMSFSIVFVGSSMGIGKSMISQKDRLAPYDVSVIYYTDQPGDDLQGRSVEEALKMDHPDMFRYLKTSADITLYNVEGQKYVDLFMKNYGGRLKSLEGIFSADLSMVGVEDYNKVRALTGLPPIELEGREYAVNYNEPDAEPLLKEYAANGPKELTLYGEQLQLKKDGIYQSTLFNHNILADLGTLIVPQEVADQGKPVMKICNGMYSGDVDEAYATVWAEMFDAVEFTNVTRVDIFVQVLSQQLAVCYIGVYLGITFLVTAGAVLALQQLIQSADNKKRYRLLGRLGVEEGTMKKSLMVQMFFCFGLPFGLAAVHSAVVLTGIYRGIPYLTRPEILENVSFAGVLAVIVYIIYFVITYTGCKRTLKI